MEEIKIGKIYRHFKGNYYYIDNICAFIKDYYEKCNLKGAVLGISGGKDSAVVAGIIDENECFHCWFCEVKKDD